MKKLLTVITGLVAGSALYAAPVLNPAEPALLTQGTFLCDEGDCWGLKFGYRGDFVYDRHMSDGSGHIDNFQFFANEGVLTLNLWDRLDIFGFVGAANYNIDDVRPSAIAGGTDIYFIGHSKTRTIWGVGAKAVLWETCWGNCGTTYLGLEGSYEGFARSSLTRASINGATAATNGVGYRFHEGQVSLGLAHRICNLVPYIAVKWSNAIGSVNGTRVGTAGAVITGTDLSGARSHRHWGYAFGVTLVDAGRMDVTAEARFIDETALSVAANIRF